MTVVLSKLFLKESALILVLVSNGRAFQSLTVLGKKEFLWQSICDLGMTIDTINIIDEELITRLIETKRN